MITDIDTEKVRKKAEAIKDNIGNLEGSTQIQNEIARDFNELLSFLPKPCEKREDVDKCRYCGACRVVRPTGEWQFNCHCDDPSKRPAKAPAGKVEEYKEISLTQGKVALVDLEDYEWLNQFKWRTKKDVHTFYAVRQEGAYPQKFFYMHREILNPPDGYSSDHINGNGLDNRRRNLRICTASQNQHNQKINEQRGSSKYKGVCWHKAVEKFAAYIKANKKLIHLGYFQSEIEAAKAYDAKATELFGEFAKLNFPNNCQSSTIKSEEFVKWLRETSWAFAGHFDGPETKNMKVETPMSVKLNDIADFLTAQAKREEELEAGKKELKERYIEAVNDMARLKRKLKNCVCPHCGFGFDQAPKGE